MNITKPTLLIDERKCKANIDRMVSKAKGRGLKLRPHFKTHQSLKVGEWFKEKGVEAITVSSLGMAKYFAGAGWNEITVAFPLNILQAELINELAADVKLNLLVDNVEAINAIKDRLTHPVSLFIEIDTGAGRTGVRFDNASEIQEVAKAIKSAEKLSLKGVYTHAGHSYKARSEEDILNIFKLTKSRIASAKEYIADLSADLEICMGDTPTCSVGEDFSGIDAISPGNFVFYDVMQVFIGSCQSADIAVAMVCPVVSINKQTREVCIYGGAVQFSKDNEEWNDKVIFGLIVQQDSKGWGEPVEGCYVKSLSQEHGIVRLSPKMFDEVKVGDLLTILPIHSCLTAEAMGSYLTLNGEFVDHYAQKNRDWPG
ncbi:DSD1 family PLP-dependent enzyme [Fulvivirga kasyanovii]|uniref:Alanine racemase n=1 Tax=Fulvivirga kasyanovii TaxID=396812 RepID=A0ABW9RMW1_9BACT|nr:alanine racemase [Fulvivirga kasyanovii]MTI25434.1 alanine racemase [Fulvivirga kasyanovii]